MPFTPAGIGVVEIGVVGVLTVVYGVPPTEALAIILVDRFISVLSIIFFGGIAYFFSPIRRGKGIVEARYRSPNRPADRRRRPPADLTGELPTRAAERAPIRRSSKHRPPGACARPQVLIETLQAGPPDLGGPHSDPSLPRSGRHA